MRRKVVFLTLVLLLVSYCFAFAGDANRPWPESIDEYVAAVKKTINLIDMEAFKKVVENKGDAVILDVREPEEYASGHVPGAINIPRGLAEFAIWKKVAGFPDKTDTSKKLYIYCKLSGRAALTAKALKDVGFTNVTSVNMKMDDWVKAGHPVER
ncbi:rhodanese-like domain-containing protein [Candidatus Magnetomonas plexicatena]|uniref:rhodanese-like domain-containing protein n=1 Tax=Candidatus Magnetomonas plexicatena TaxID=2552947 RepID=UPI0011055DA0|nr:rhodanese-like domain-containing protein [Nitrospirales bacterium LBB_01]